jgi:hypothetical protein
MALPICFRDVAYFKNQFQGDLVITPGVIYYIPRAAESGNWDEVPAVAKALAGGEVFLMDTVERVVTRLQREIINAVNSRNLKQKGLWKDGQSSSELQARLDSFVSDEKASPSRENYHLLRPLRFSKHEIKNVVVRFGCLTFDTECDHHDFRIGLRSSRALRDALWEANFIRPH